MAAGLIIEAVVREHGLEDHTVFRNDPAVLQVDIHIGGFASEHLLDGGEIGVLHADGADVLEVVHTAVDQEAVALAGSGNVVEAHGGVAVLNTKDIARGHGAAVQHHMAAVIGVDAVAVAAHIDGGIVGLLIDIAAGGVGRKCGPCLAVNLAAVEIAFGIVHRQMRAAVAAKTQGGGGLHHAGADNGHIALRQGAAVGGKLCIKDLQGGAGGCNGGGTGGAVGDDGAAADIHLSTGFCQNSGTLAGKVAASAAGKGNFRLQHYAGAAFYHHSVELRLVAFQLHGQKIAGLGEIGGIVRKAGTGGIDFAAGKPQGGLLLLRMGEGGTVILGQRIPAADEFCFFVQICHWACSFQG